MSSSTASSSEKKSAVEICKGPGGLKKVIIRDVSGYSAESAYKPPQPIRGGIPICFPQVSILKPVLSTWNSYRPHKEIQLDLQFSNNGPHEQHGFARVRFWDIDPSPPPLPTNYSDMTFVDFILRPKDLLPKDKTFWPHRFECRTRVGLRPMGELLLTTRIRNINTDGKSFTFSFAYHTYFSVSDISEVRVEGLETMDYLDNLKNRVRFTEQGDAITFESEVDKIYLATPTKIALLDHAKKQTFEIYKEGLPDTAVWNPWDKKAKAMADFGNNEYSDMLCVSPAAVETPITLKPGEEWTGRQKLCVVPSSYCSGQLDPQRVVRGS
ncbi:glucose-6-phosphate 1-epimerase [Dorcoceras hygrometricum]|nr:glucose-6-phosphate 1-epimerase [Dorcoceras hygrometricum]